MKYAMRDLMEPFLQYRTGLKQSGRTVNECFYEVNMFLRFMESRGVVHCDELSKDKLMEYQTHLSEKTVKGMPYTPQTINKKIKEAKNFLRYVCDRGHMLKELVETLKSVKAPRRLPLDVLEHCQIRNTLEKIDIGSPLAYRDRTMVEVLYSTAIRASELSGMDIGSVDIGNAMIKIHGKGDKERMVPVGKTAMRFLETYIKAVRPFMIASPSERKVFVNAKGQGITRHAVTKIVHHHYPKGDFNKNVTAHTFRRSCATELIKADANVYHVKELLGHESLDTMKSYVNLSGVEIKKMHSQFHPREKDVEND